MLARWWRCLRGGDEKCSNNSSKESKWALPATSAGLLYNAERVGIASRISDVIKLEADWSIISLSSADCSPLCSPLFDSSNRLESIDQVDIIVVSPDAVKINFVSGYRDLVGQGFPYLDVGPILTDKTVTNLSTELPRLTNLSPRFTSPDMILPNFLMWSSNTKSEAQSYYIQLTGRLLMLRKYLIALR